MFRRHLPPVHPLVAAAACIVRRLESRSMQTVVHGTW